MKKVAAPRSKSPFSLGRRSAAEEDRVDGDAIDSASSAPAPAPHTSSGKAGLFSAVRSRSNSGAASPGLARRSRSFSWRDPPAADASTSDAAIHAILIPRSVPEEAHAGFAAALAEEMGRPNPFTFFHCFVKSKGADGTVCLAITGTGVAGLPTRNTPQLAFFHGWSFIKNFLTPLNLVDCAGYTLWYQNADVEFFFRFENVLEQKLFLKRVRELSSAFSNPAATNAGVPVPAPPLEKLSSGDRTDTSRFGGSSVDEERELVTDTNSSFDLLPRAHVN